MVHVANKIVKTDRMLQCLLAFEVHALLPQRRWFFDFRVVCTEPHKAQLGSPTQTVLQRSLLSRTHQETCHGLIIAVHQLDT